MAVSCWDFYCTRTHRYIVHPKPPITGRRAAIQFNIAEDLIITDRKQYARHRRNYILVDIEFYVSDMFDVTILERYIVLSYRLNYRLPNPLFSWDKKKQRRCEAYSKYECLEVTYISEICMLNIILIF